MKGRDYVYLSHSDNAFNNIEEKNKIQIFNAFYKRGFSYDPYSSTFLNPLLGVMRRSKDIVHIDIEVLESGLDSITAIMSDLFVAMQYPDVSRKIQRRFQLVFATMKLFEILLYLGILSGALIAYLFDFGLGLIIALYSVYLSLKHHYLHNANVAMHEGHFATSNKWKKYKLFYSIIPPLLFLCSIYFLYEYLDNIWLAISVMIITRAILEIYIYFELSSIYWARMGLMDKKDYIQPN
jgi:hypothetical protein